MFGELSLVLANMLIRLAVFLWSFHVIMGQNGDVPDSPCPEFFRYYVSQTRETFGAMTVKNDLSGEYYLVVNMSFPILTDKVSGKLV